MFPPISNLDLNTVSPHLTWASTTLLNPPIQWLPILFRSMAVMTAAPIVFLSILDVVAYLIARTLGAGSHHHLPPHYGSDSPPLIPPLPISPGSHQPSAISLPPDSKLVDRHDLLAPTITISPPTVTSLGAGGGGVEPHSLESALNSIQLPTPPSESSSTSTSSTSSSDRLSPDSPRLFPQLHFTSASEGNFALAGEGLFSPPESRSNSPPVERWMARKRGASLTGSDAGSSDSSSSLSGGSSMAMGSATGLPTPNASLRKRMPGLQFTPMHAPS